GAVLLVFLGSLSNQIPPVLFTEIGLWLLVLGLIEGVPTGFYYHLVLYRILGPRSQLPPRWWMSPQQYHVHLDEKERRVVRRWFLLGGIGFIFSVIGGALVFLGLISGFQQGTIKLGR
ncbi:MAG TPA: hypothetical protein VNV63_00675, partial [Nitrospiria bacterium]|nr:hypothetical protein [Nitrospiria bacterium]